MSDEDEEVYSYVAVVLHLEWDSDMLGTYSTIHGVTQDQELCVPVVSVDLFHSGFSFF
jgi:hypothetical protein